MLVRPMTPKDLPELIDLQEQGAVVALAEVFPQDRYPFPREAIVARWRVEVSDPHIGTIVAVDERGGLVGFAATTDGELLHFGTSIETWGHGAAAELLKVVVELLKEATNEPTLRVFEGNGRARRFYEKYGWRPSGAESESSFEPHPVLLEYTLVQP